MLLLAPWAGVFAQTPRAAAKKAAPAKPAAPPRDPMAEAQALLDSGHPLDAATLLKDVVEQNPDNFAVWFNLGVAYGMAGQDANAIEAFRKTLALEPKLYEAELNLGRMLLRRKEYAEAEKLLAEASTQRPREIPPLMLLGDALLQSGQLAEAERPFRAAADLNPKLAEAHYRLARVLSTQSKWSDSAAALAKYVQLKPEDEPAQLELASYYEKAGQPLEAAAIYRRFPNNVAAVERAGLLALQAGDAKQAVAELAAVVAKDPTPASRYALATALMRSGDLEHASEVASQIVEQQPSSLEMRLFYGRLLRDQRKYRPAAQQFFACTKLKPDSLESWRELTSMLVLLNDYEPALQALERSKELGGENAAYFWFRAIMLDALKQPKPALASYQRFLELSNGKSPDEEFKARQRARILTKVLSK